MRILFDTNVVLDLLLDRQPFAEPAAALFARVERGEDSGYLCATTVTTIFYLASKTLGAGQARLHVKTLLELFEIAPVSRPVVEGALLAGFDDFEDAVLHEAARHADVQCIVTRNIKDFKRASLPVYMPDELLAGLAGFAAVPPHMCHQELAEYKVDRKVDRKVGGKDGPT